MSLTSLRLIVITSLFISSVFSALSNIDMLTYSPAAISLSGTSGVERIQTSISYGGDINNDGLDDLLIGDFTGDPALGIDAGIVYVVFGVPGGLSSVDVKTLTSTQGFRIFGEQSSDQLGNSVKNAGDVNGDGIDDIIIGAPSADPLSRTDAGCAYVIFGKTEFGDIDLASLTSTQGFKIMGAVSGDNAGLAVSSAGDMNGDGVDDVVVGCPGADRSSKTDVGITYVIFGNTTGLTNIDLNILTSAQGFSITGENTNDVSGKAVSYAGDFNNDTIDDIIIGAHKYDFLSSRFDTGSVYVIFGKKTGLNNISLDSLVSTQGIRFFGGNSYDELGISVSYAGDVNGDGVADVIVGAFMAELYSRSDSGVAYVIFGETGISTNSGIDMARFNNSQGFKISGATTADRFGYSVSYAGDMNGDGLSDVVIGAYFYKPIITRNLAGCSYVVYGKSSGISDVDTYSFDTDNSEGFKVVGATFQDLFGIVVTYAGNINGISAHSVMVRTQKVSSATPSYIISGEAKYYYWDGTESVLCPSPLRIRAQSQKLYCEYLCNPNEYLYWNGSCRNSCTLGLRSRPYKGKNFCDYPCSGSEYLSSNGVCSTSCNPPLIAHAQGFKKFCGGPSFIYWDGTQSSKCDSPFDTRITNDSAYCDYPCNDLTNYLYWDNSCQANCSNGLKSRPLKGRNFCDYPCLESEYLYTNGACISSCESPYVIVLKASKQFCYYQQSTSQSQLPTAVSVSKITETLNSNLQSVLSFIAATNPVAALTSVLSKMFLYTRYLNITNSPRLETLYYNSETDPGCVDIAPNIPSQAQHIYYLSSSNFKFTQYHLGASFLLNYWNAFISLSIMFGCFGLIWIINFILQRKPKKHIIWTIAAKVKIFAQNFTIQQFYMTIGDIAVYTLLEAQAQGFKFSLSFAIGILFSFIGVSMLTYHAFLVRQYQKLRILVQKNQKYKEKLEKFCEASAGFKVLFDEFRDDSFLYQGFLLFFVIRDIVFGLLIAAFYPYPLIQISIIFIASVPILYYTIKKKPHKDFIDYIQHISLELALLTVNFALLELAILDVAYTKYTSAHYYFGEAIIYCNIMSHFIPIVCLGIKIIRIIVIHWKKIWSGSFRTILSECINAFSFNPEEEAPQLSQIAKTRPDTSNYSNIRKVQPDIESKSSELKVLPENAKETAIQRDPKLKSTIRSSIKLINLNSAIKSKESQTSKNEDSNQAIKLESSQEIPSSSNVLMPNLLDRRTSPRRSPRNLSNLRERKSTLSAFKSSNLALEIRGESSNFPSLTESLRKNSIYKSGERSEDNSTRNLINGDKEFAF